MPDIRTILRTFSPAHALRNARRDVVEHARVIAEIDAIVERLPGASSPPVPLAVATTPDVDGSSVDVGAEDAPVQLADPVVEERRAS